MPSELIDTSCLACADPVGVHRDQIPAILAAWVAILANWNDEDIVTCFPAGNIITRADVVFMISIYTQVVDGGCGCSECPPQPEPPCSSPTAPFVPEDPTCMGLIEDVTAAVLAVLPPPVPGPVGPTGFTGATGPTGIQGIQGLIGLLGPQGFTGEIGESGPIGPQGFQGLIGIQGFTGPRGPRGFPGVGVPQQGVFLADFLRNLAAQISRLLREDRSGRSLPPSSPTITATVGLPALLPERVAPGGTISAPVVEGSSADPTGTIRPVFGIVPRGQPTPIPAQQPTLLQTGGRLLQQILQAFLNERHRDFLRDQARRNRDIAQANQTTLLAFLAALRGSTMGFGQRGFGFSGGDGGGGGFLGGLSGLLSAATPLISNLFGPQAPVQSAVALPALAFGGLAPAIGRQLPGIVGGLGIGELIGQLGGGGGGAPPGQLFRNTMTRVVPISEFSMIGPDGKCHTWLHATPKGWKINKSNVSGRRRHRHPR